MPRLSFHIRTTDFARNDCHASGQGRSPQLCRKTFAERVNMEYNLEKERVHCMNFCVMVFTTFLCLGTYDPLDQISDIHYNLEQQFEIERVEHLHNHEDIMSFVKVFIDASYRMAPALIDANTKDDIDFARCTDDSVEDVCKLRYWMLDTGSKFMRGKILNDQLGPENVRPSRMDCSSANPPSNCIDRISQLRTANLTGVKGRTNGLIPEDPIILKSRLDYPQSSLVPLMPVLWQVRSPRRPCEGFGDKYNLGILGAGLCDVDKPCNPDTVTSFAGTKPSPAGRDQTFYITYSEDAFFCVDRAEYAEVFHDKSWSPWASHHDLTVGKITASVEFGGKPVFYKFVSDVAYLQRPINGTLQIHPNYCSGSSSTTSGCHDGHDTICDPYDEAHHMWTETASSLLYSTCSLRGEWTRRYLQTPIHERANSFLTLETTELTIAVLVITPQTSAYRDVQTLIRVIFNIGQGGTVSSTVSIMSTSQTWWWWYIVAATSLCSSSVYVLMAAVVGWKILKAPPEIRRLYTQPLKKIIFDIVIGLLVFSAMGTLIIIDLLPPHVTDELIDAFKTNKQSQYFNVLQNIVKYNDTLAKAKGFIFVVACILFVRLCLFLSLHPRLAMFLNTLSSLLKHMTEMSTYFLMIQSFLCYVAWWMFGAERQIEYGTLSRSVYTSLTMFVADIELNDTETNVYYIVYLLVYVGSICIVLLNIFLALVIDAFEEVKSSVAERQTEMSLFNDFLEVTIIAIWRRQKGYPSTKILWQYLKTSGRGFHDDVGNAPAITAKELFDSVVDLENNKQQAFTSVVHAQEFINHYVYKIIEHGNYVLCENRAALTFDDGECWKPESSESFRDYASSPDVHPDGPPHEMFESNQRTLAEETTVDSELSLEMVEKHAEKAEERAERAEQRAERAIKVFEQFAKQAQEILERAQRAEEPAEAEEVGVSEDLVAFLDSKLQEVLVDIKNQRQACSQGDESEVNRAEYTL